jgi:hypothetical protein
MTGEELKKMKAERNEFNKRRPAIIRSLFDRLHAAMRSDDRLEIERRRAEPKKLNIGFAIVAAGSAAEIH